MRHPFRCVASVPDVVSAQRCVGATIGVDRLPGGVRVFLTGESQASSRASTMGSEWWFSGMGPLESTIFRPSSVASSFSVIGEMTVPGATAFSGIPAPAQRSVIHSRRTQRLSARLLDV